MLGSTDADGSVDVRQFDLRVGLMAGSGPGDPGYISVIPEAYRYVSWWSSWPLNPHKSSAALLQVHGMSDLWLTEGRFNQPLGRASWLRLVNPLTPLGCMPPSGTCLLSLALHNQPVSPAVNQLPFTWSGHLVVAAGSTVRLGWGTECTPSPPVTIRQATGFAPFSKVRVRLSTAVAGFTSRVVWCPSDIEEAFVDNVVHNPPASESADLMLDNSAGALNPDVYWQVEFS